MYKIQILYIFLGVVINSMLSIAVVAYNFELSCKAIKILAKNDANSKPKIIYKDKIIMNDNTRYQAFPTYNHARDCWIDQIILVDDFRWHVYDQQYELIDWLKLRLYCTSNVPEEFQIQRYEW